MSNIREMTTKGVDNPEVRYYMEKFWESYDKLFVDMDNLTEEEFIVRQNEMWSWRNKASEIEGDMFLISLWGMSRKSEELYGNDIHVKYIEFLTKNKDE
jgi:hypothetical protein